MDNWLIGSGGVIIALNIIKITNTIFLYCLRKFGVKIPILEPIIVIIGNWNIKQPPNSIHEI